MTISAKDVKALRDRTGAGMMDCKKALQETDGDMEAAIDFLRAKGSAKAAKRAAKVRQRGHHRELPPLRWEDRGHGGAEL